MKENIPYVPKGKVEHYKWMNDNFSATHDLLSDMAPIFPSGRRGSLELVVEQIEERIPHLDNPAGHGSDVLLP